MSTKWGPLNSAQTEVEPSNKLRTLLDTNFTKVAIQHGIESEKIAVKQYLTEIQQQGFNQEVEELGCCSPERKKKKIFGS